MRPHARNQLAGVAMLAIMSARQPVGAVVYVRVPREVKAEADRQCDTRGVPLAKLVARALEAYLISLGWDHERAEPLP